MARARKKRVYGTRSTGGLLIYGAERLASLVIGAYRTQARQEAPNWSRDYLAGINDYITDEQKVRTATTKLSLWYQALAENRSAIIQAFDAVKARYAQLLAGLVVPAPAPAPAPAAPAPRAVPTP
ncbi:hypothetical protein ATG_17500 [Desulfurococcaceae archaeon AG1]|nr:hypothetical protein ATG_17500 [Desulfurococcaceae archaeon AG1]